MTLDVAVAGRLRDVELAAAQSRRVIRDDHGDEQRGADDERRPDGRHDQCPNTSANNMTTHRQTADDRL